MKRDHDFSFDIALEARLQTAAMEEAHVITRTNFANLYWTISQQLAHHTVAGCNLQTGDLLASGTIRGETENARGCMLELTGAARIHCACQAERRGSGLKTATR